VADHHGHVRFVCAGQRFGQAEMVKVGGEGFGFGAVELFRRGFNGFGKIPGLAGEGGPVEDGKAGAEADRGRSFGVFDNLSNCVEKSGSLSQLWMMERWIPAARDLTLQVHALERRGRRIKMKR
jgi:hypothetical protein